MTTYSRLRQLPLPLQPAHAHGRYDLSAVRCDADGYLWLGSDEAAGLERLTLDGDTIGEHQHLDLGDYLDLPDGKDEEIDIEGLAYADYYLWVAGSHSLKRKKPQPDNSSDENMERLATLSRDENRYLLGRIPLVNGQLHHQCLHPERPEQVLTAAQLQRKRHGNQLTKVLKKDPHLRPFLKADIPGKDNGFDIEGLAVAEDRLFVGLRGPVLRGWAILLELQVKEKTSERLRLRQREDGHRYRKYFLDLAGMGIRDLCWQGADLLILAGPTMALNGAIGVFRLADALDLSPSQCLTPDHLFEIPHGHDTDRAEGITLCPDPSSNLLVVYDAPAPHRLNAETHSVLADVFALE
ncbi:hypothetical protein XM38_028600 [Halomicronema hongdechloris C2206]|uniref:DUF3616 domain-containing protein n=1 Tax=Halomicronema hongdechloris C2206 TaxID=1641165 RepID=A0A1Z3HNQ3_9CYAN|nr:DUF3616 domain-containing protein [Halomicronema hongdechloris]ASC71906.1 hypothetical protein XM38_028600 [Halomicronema hongdechloris C2206]